MGFEASLAFSVSLPANSSLPITFSHSLSSMMARVKRGHAVVQLGEYWSIAGTQQHINMQDMIGDTFTLTNKSSSNGLVGFN